MRADFGEGRPDRSQRKLGTLGLLRRSDPNHSTARWQPGDRPRPAGQLHRRHRPARNAAARFRQVQLRHRSLRIPRRNDHGCVLACDRTLAQQSSTCTATVANAAGTAGGAATGNVTFTASAGGTFAGGANCALSGTAASAACSVSYSPTSVGSGSQTVTASYSGDTAHQAWNRYHDVGRSAASPCRLRSRARRAR